jgi:hypothetical protein
VTITGTPVVDSANNVFGLGLNLIAWTAIIGGAGVVLGMILSFIVGRLISSCLHKSSNNSDLKASAAATQMSLVTANYSPLASPISPMAQMGQMGGMPMQMQMNGPAMPNAMGMPVGGGFASPPPPMPGNPTMNQQMLQQQPAFDYGY